MIADCARTGRRPRKCERYGSMRRPASIDAGVFAFARYRAPTAFSFRIKTTRKENAVMDKNIQVLE